MQKTPNVTDKYSLCMWYAALQQSTLQDTWIVLICPVVAHLATPVPLLYNHSYRSHKSEGYHISSASQPWGREALDLQVGYNGEYSKIAPKILLQICPRLLGLHGS